MPSAGARGPVRASAMALAIALALAVPVACAAAGWPVNGIAVAPLARDQGDPAIAGDLNGVFIGWIGGSPSGLATFLQRFTSNGEREFGWPDTGLRVLPMHANTTLLADGSGGVYVAADPASTLGAAMITHITPEASVVYRWPLTLPSNILSAAGESEPDRENRVALEDTPPRETNAVIATYLPALALTPNGGLVASWLHSLQYTTFETTDHVHLGFFKTNGEPQSGWQRYGTAVGYDDAAPPHQSQLVMCGDDSGGAFVAYVSRSPGLPHATIHHLAGDASRNDWFDVCPTCGRHDAIGIVSDGAGGAYLAWQDYRAGAYQQTYLQRIASDDSIADGWPVDGLAVCTRPTHPGTLRQLFGAPMTGSSIVSDGTGGAYLAWTDDRDAGITGGGDIYAQRVLGDGTIAPGWPAQGLPICRVPGEQALPALVGDGAGGLYVAWQDARSGASDVYVQHVDANGTRRFAEDGLALCDAPGDQEHPVLAADGAGGAYAAWIDSRSGTRNLYVSIVADIRTPALVALHEALADPGRVRLTWFVGDAASAAIERRTESTPWRPVGTAEARAGWLSFEDRDVAPGIRYGYRLRLAGGGETIAAGEAWIETPRGARLALDGARPNPARGAFLVAFELSGAGPATLDVLDVSGRRRATREVGTLGGGRHLVRIDAAGWRPGVYWLRLEGGGRAIGRRALLAE